MQFSSKMPLRMLMRYFLNNEAVIQKLAESYPMRRAAQLTAYVFHKSKAIGEEAVDKFQESGIKEKAKQDMMDAGQKAQNFTSRFSEELRSGFREMQEELSQKKKPPR